MENQRAEEIGLKQLSIPWDGDVDDPKTKKKPQQMLEEKRLRILLDSSSVSGLPKIVSASSLCSRLFWSVLLVAGIVGFIVNMYYITVRYISLPILNVNEVEHETFVWPDIIVCNPMNPLAFWKYPQLVSKWNDTGKKALWFTSKLPYLRGFEHSIQMSSINLQEFKVDDPRNMFPYWTYKLALTPMRPKNSFYNAMESSFDFTGFNSLSHTMAFPFPCYRISIPSIPEIYLKKRLEKLETINLLAIMAEKSYQLFNCRSADRGLYIYIVPQNHTITVTEPRIVSPGGILDLRIFMHRTERLKEKTNCIDKPFLYELFDASLTRTQTYKGNYDDCVNFASQEVFLKECNCYNPIFPIHRSFQFPPKLCFNMTLFSDKEVIANAACLNKIFDEYKDSKKFTDILKQKCSKYSRPLCNELKYIAEASTTIMNHEANQARRSMLMYVMTAFMKYKELQSGLKTAVRNVATMKFHKGKKTGSYSTQELEYTTSQFISDIGGIVGLWVGLSVVGLFELVEITYATALLVCAKVGQRRQGI